MDFYPVMVDLRDQPCVVIGGGAVAERKVAALLACGARVKVITPVLSRKLRAWAEQGRIIVVGRPYRDGDLADTFLVISAADDIEVNEAAAAEAGRRRVLLNAADAPQLGNFIVPAVVRQGPLVVAVSTGGTSPALARKIRQELQETFGPEYAVFLTLLGRMRERVQNSFATQAERQRFWDSLVRSDLLDLIAKGRIEEAEEKMRHAVDCAGT